MSLYIVTHKIPNPVLHKKGYKYLLVGAYKGHIFGDCFDDVGDNISSKNSNYCELTGLYWLWKNCKDDYIGICHYRRFFSKSFRYGVIATEEELLCKLSKYDMIVPFIRKLKMSVKEQYCESSGYEQDLYVIREILKEKYPDYVPYYDLIINGNNVYFANMLVTTKEIFDRYCEWLFDILFEAEKRIDISEYNPYQKRIYGFLAERLLIVWIHYNKIKVFEMGVVNTEEKWPLWKRIATGLKRKLLYYVQF